MTIGNNNTSNIVGKEDVRIVMISVGHRLVFKDVSHIFYLTLNLIFTSMLDNEKF